MTKEAQEYVDRIREKFLSGDDSAVYSILQELNEHQETYLEVWGCFPASVRRQLKEIQVKYRDQ